MPFTAFASTGITGWEADFTLKVMRRNSASRMTVQALYSALMNEFDNSTEMDDKVPMSAQTPTEFSLINGWHIPESSMDYLSGGSIQTIGYDAAVGTNADPIYVLTASAFAAQDVTVLHHVLDNPNAAASFKGTDFEELALSCCA